LGDVTILDTLIEEQEKFRRNVIGLQPSENTIPRKALRAMSSDFEQRYSLVIDADYRNSKIHNAYAGTERSEALVETVEKLARKTFKKGFADVRPISGHIAALQVIGNSLKRGERFLYIPVRWGGYDGYEPQYLPAMLNIRGEKIPMKGWKIDYEKIEKFKKHYSAVVLGASIFLHPYDLRRIKESFPDSLILYDASHVFGLLSSNQFQKDMNIVDVVYGSTHKNFPGPQGGLIVGKKEFEDTVKAGAIWKYYDNFHLARIASLGFSLEYLSTFPYGKLCINNTRALIRELKERSIPLVNSPTVTESSMFMLDQENISGISDRMESAGILIDKIGRVGLNEVTMRGLTEEDMIPLADAMEHILKNEVDEARKVVKSILVKMRWPE
jgi:glycine hydroxymethyltransferase